MKIHLSTFYFLIVFLVSADFIYSNDLHEIKTSNALLSLDSNEVLKIKGYVNNNSIDIKTNLNSIWNLLLNNKSTGRSSIVKPNGTALIKATNNEITVQYKNLFLDGEKLPIEVNLSFGVHDDAFRFNGKIINKSNEWSLISLDYPVLQEIKINTEQSDIYWPSGLGRHFSDPKSFGKRTLNYPSREGAMPWFTITGENEGVYIGIHNAERLMTDYTLEYNEDDNTFSSNITTPIFKDSIIISDVFVKLYQGKWHDAAKFYRKWYDTNFQIAKKPKWVEEDNGWLLTILKQQNGNVMWPYDKLDQLSDVAMEFDLSTIGLYGWAHGGHDRYYPNYVPDNLMGGREELKKGIEIAQKKGIKIILYANGRLMDTATEFYQYWGNEAMMMDEKLKPILETWRKHFNSTPVVFAKGCPGSDLWRDTMAKLALQAIELGADGIIFDQVGSFPHLCYSENHDHVLPQEAFTKYRNKMLKDIRSMVHEIDEDFVIMVESVNDALLNEIDYFHGVGRGCSLFSPGYPELFRYTFPELTVTQRNRNPMIPRDEANFATVYGLKYEIECRYDADVDYLLNDVFPTDESYANITSKPDPKKIGEMTTDEARKYLKSLISFKKENSKFLEKGKFIDQEGFEVTGNIVAKGYIYEDEIGIVLWNRNQEKSENFNIKIPGYKFIKASEPTNTTTKAYSKLATNSIRLLVFSKN